MQTQIEIERKFVIKKIPGNLPKFFNHEIEQGYLAVSQDGDEVRLRKKGDVYLLTVKSGGTLERRETEIILNAAQFATLWPLTEGKRILKRRFDIPDGEDLIELDIFENALAPLIIAEVEFPSIEASKAYKPPTWFDKEVTNDKRYKNRNLAIHGIPEN